MRARLRLLRRLAHEMFAAGLPSFLAALFKPSEVKPTGHGTPSSSIKAARLFMETALLFSAPITYHLTASFRLRCTKPHLACRA
jgi:hypothetical protein